jgi:hypothetical protein
MRKEIGQAVRKLFDEGMRRRHPQFVPVKSMGHTQINPGSRVYCWMAAPDLSFFVILLTHLKEPDNFWVEAAWSPDQRVPIMYPDLHQKQRERRNIGKFWGARNGWYEWEVSRLKSLAGMTQDEFDDWLRNQERVERERIEEGLRRAPECVEDARNRIDEYVLPYFKKIAESRGCDLSSSQG